MSMLALTHLPSPRMQDALRMEPEAPAANSRASAAGPANSGAAAGLSSSAEHGSASSSKSSSSPSSNSAHHSAEIDLPVANRQHAAYRQALRQLGAKVIVLDANLRHPDCVFIEDTAVIFDEGAVLCSMGHASRRGEPGGVEAELRRHREVYPLRLPATMDGGDVLRIGRTFLVGLSTRTNSDGVEAFRQTVGRHGYQVLPVAVRHCLHLKSAVTALPDGRLLGNPAWFDQPATRDFPFTPLPAAEPDAGNVLLLGGAVLSAAGHPQTAELITSLGHRLLTTDLSEFAKADGCVTCLSLLLG